MLNFLLLRNLLVQIYYLLYNSSIKLPILPVEELGFAVLFLRRQCSCFPPYFNLLCLFILLYSSSLFSSCLKESFDRSMFCFWFNISMSKLFRTLTHGKSSAQQIQKYSRQQYIQNILYWYYYDQSIKFMVYEIVEIIQHVRILNFLELRRIHGNIFKNILRHFLLR